VRCCPTLTGIPIFKGKEDGCEEKDLLGKDPLRDSLTWQ
jgi:hypothetical protein